MSLAPLSEAAVAQLAKQAGRPSKGLHRITGKPTAASVEVDPRASPGRKTYTARDKREKPGVTPGFFSCA